MRFWYNILFLVFFALSSPWYFFKMWRRGNWRPGFKNRLGRYDPHVKQAITNRRTIWIHAVSMGEAGVCARLLAELEPRLPNHKFVVSTTTTTGMGELRRRLPSHISKIYYPIDRRKFVARALATFHPEAIILVEAEIWPNFIWRARSQGIPLFLVNARMSNRSYPRYLRMGFLFRDLFASFAGVGVQNEADADKLRAVGCRPAAIRVVGSMKYDANSPDKGLGLDVPRLLRQSGAFPDAPVLVAGSTHPGEEAILAGVFLKLRQRFPNLFLVVVPRHFERCREAERDIAQRNLKVIYRTEIRSTTAHRPGSVDCLLVNTNGELRHFYGHATVVFIGKTLSAEGGQNPIEPAALGKPIVFGPNMQNFADIAAAMLAAKGAIQVQNAGELETALGDLLASDEKCESLGNNARELVQRNSGATRRTVDMILDGLENSEPPRSHGPRKN
jgi:3-deoxy-D-manno-octulosonic-acid transferase